MNLGQGNSVVEKSQYTVNVIGAGAVGCFYGGKLVQNGYQVTFYGRSFETTPTHKQILVNSIWGGFSFQADFTSRLAALKPADLVIVSCKALPEIDYRELLGSSIKKETIILFLQNGIFIEDQIQKLYPSHTIGGALAFTCINRLSHVHIDHSDYGHVKIAALKKNLHHRRKVEIVAQIFQQSGIPTEFCSDLHSIRWHKLVWNIAFNPVSVILNSDTKKIMDNPQTRELVNRLMREVQTIAFADGCKIKNSFVQQMLENTVKMRPYLTSMLLDFRSRRPLELQAILKNPLQRAQRKKVSVPTMLAIYELAYFLDQQNRTES